MEDKQIHTHKNIQSLPGHSKPSGGGGGHAEERLSEQRAEKWAAGEEPPHFGLKAFTEPSGPFQARGLLSGMDAGGQDDTGSLGVTCLALGLLMGFVTSWDPEGRCSCLNPLAFSSISSAPALPTAKCRKISFQVWVGLGFFKGCFEGRCGTHLCE